MTTIHEVGSQHTILHSQPPTCTQVENGKNTSHEIFVEDVEKQSTQVISRHTEELESKQITFWDKLYAWWTGIDLSVKKPSTNIPETDSLNSAPVNPISPIPQLEKPLGFDSQRPLPLIREKPSSHEKLSESKIIEGLSSMSSFTLETIMLILLKAQLEIETENAKNCEKNFDKFHQFKKLQQKALQDIKDTLAKDENVSKIFQSGHNLTVAATFLCGIAAAASTAGILVYAPAIVQSVATLLAEIGPLFMGSAATLTGAGSIYFKNRTNQSRVNLEQWNHKDKHYSNAYEETRKRILEIMESDGVFKEKLGEWLKRNHKIKQYIMSQI